LTSQNQKSVTTVIKTADEQAQKTETDNAYDDVVIPKAEKNNPTDDVTEENKPENEPIAIDPKFAKYVKMISMVLSIFLNINPYPF